MSLASIAFQTLKSVVAIVVTFGIFLLMRRIAGDVGGMPQVFRDAFEPSVFVRTETFTPAIVALMSVILLHLLINFLMLRDHMRISPPLRGAVYGLLFGGLWFIGFLELVVIYDSSLERHVLSGVRDLVTLTCFGIVSGLLFSGGLRSRHERRFAPDAGLAAVFVAIAFSAFHWAQYPLTLNPIEQSVDDAGSVLWLLATGAWIGAMYAFLGHDRLRPTARVLFFSFNTFGLNWLFYTSFYLLFLDMPVADTLLRCAFDSVGVAVGLLLFERLRKKHVPNRPSRRYER